MIRESWIWIAKRPIHPSWVENWANSGCSVARCGQRSMATILMGVMAVILKKAERLEEAYDWREVQMWPGSTTHRFTTHSECCLNPKNSSKEQKKSGDSINDRKSENDVIYYSEDFQSDAESIALKDVLTSTGSSSWFLRWYIISGIVCWCGVQSRAHKECPLDSRNRAGFTLFPKADSGKVSTGSAHLEHLEDQHLGKRCWWEASPWEDSSSRWGTVWICMIASWASATFLAVLCKSLVIDAYCVFARDWLCEGAVNDCYQWCDWELQSEYHSERCGRWSCKSGSVQLWHSQVCWSC